MVLPSGELHIREVGPEDGYKSYQCRTKHRLTGETRLSATKGRLVITGNLKFSIYSTIQSSSDFDHFFRRILEFSSVESLIELQIYKKK
jgi:hypothetical protein